MSRLPGRVTVMMLTIATMSTVTLCAGPMAGVALAQTPSPAVDGDVADFGLPGDALIAGQATWQVDDQPPGSVTVPGPDDVMRSLTSALQQLPPGVWDPGVLSASFGGDPERAFTFVRDSIGFDPYRGVLRGAAGTLAARAGSAADRALLLASLLGSMGFTTRFAFADLDASAAERLLARSLEPPVTPLSGPGADIALDPSMMSAVAQRAHRDHALLRQAIGDVASQLGAGGVADPLAALTKHTWVQLERDGAWVDLDPSLPDMQPGDVVAPAGSTADANPLDERATVTIRIHAENLVDGAVQETVALDQTLDAADASAAQVLLYFRPQGGGGLVGAVGPPAAYEPALWVDGESTIGTAIQVLPPDDAFFGSGSDVRLTRVVLELSVQSPGGEPVTSQRVLLDRVSADLRSSGSWTVDDLAPMPVVDDLPAVMMGVHEIGVSTGGSDPIATLESAIGSVFVSAQLTRADESGAAPPYLPMGIMLLPLTSSTANLVLASEHGIVPGLDLSVEGRTFIGSPRLFVVSMAPDPTLPDAVQVTTDLAVDGIDVVAAPGAAQGPSAAAQRLWYGAVETALETEFIRRVAGGLEPADRYLDGVSLRMEEPLTVIDDPSGSDGASGLLREAVAAGDIAVVPGDVPTARLWWTVDRSDGTTRSILDPGIRAGVAGGSPGGVMEHWGADWDPDTNNWSRWNDKTVVRRRCGSGNESQEVTNCVSAPTTAQIAQLFARLMKDYARYMLLP